MHRTIEHSPRVAEEPSRFARIIHRLFVTFAVIMAVLACVQPIFAGMSLDGNELGLYLHGYTAWAIWLVVLILLVLSILWWRPGKGPGWAPILTGVIFIAAAFQPFAAVWGLFALHLPLGVAIVVGSLTLAGLLLRRSSKTTRTGPRVREAA